MFTKLLLTLSSLIAPRKSRTRLEDYVLGLDAVSIDAAAREAGQGDKAPTAISLSVLQMAGLFHEQLDRIVANLRHPKRRDTATVPFDAVLIEAVPYLYFCALPGNDGNSSSRMHYEPAFQVTAKLLRELSGRELPLRFVEGRIKSYFMRRDRPIVRATGLLLQAIGSSTVQRDALEAAVKSHLKEFEKTMIPALRENCRRAIQRYGHH